MIKHTIPATNRMSSKETTIELVTDPGQSHAELRMSGGLQLLPNGELALNIDNETARAFARSILDTVPAPRR